MAAGARPPVQLQAGRAAAEAGLKLGPRATDRERRYLAAVSALFADYERVDPQTRVTAYERALALTKTLGQNTLTRSVRPGISVSPSGSRATSYSPRT